MFFGACLLAATSIFPKEVHLRSPLGILITIYTIISLTWSSYGCTKYYLHRYLCSFLQVKPTEYIFFSLMISRACFISILLSIHLILLLTMKKTELLLRIMATFSGIYIANGLAWVFAIPYVECVLVALHLWNYGKFWATLILEGVIVVFLVGGLEIHPITLMIGLGILTWLLFSLAFDAILARYDFDL
jgi:drug/metabolite transporter superfamily protein YnfA